MRKRAVKLFAIPASHPCAAAGAMLEAKGIGYDRIDLFPAFSRGWLRLRGFGAGTVPALRAGRERVQGTRSIARWLDARWPDPPLLPAEPAARARIEEIEAWADGPLQDAVRQIIVWVLLRDRRAVASVLEGVRLQFRTPASVARRVAWPVVRLEAAFLHVTAESVREAVASLPALLDRADAWIAAGELAAGPPSAADYQVAGSVRLLLIIEDLAPLTRDRPAASLARTLIPAFPGSVARGALPAAWLA
jgi:glutathione S-transferase